MTFDYTKPKYSFHIGEIVKTKIDLWTENSEFIPAGSKIRLVTFTPKVRMYTADGYRVDTKELFFNAVKDGQVQDFSNRIRANFCTIQKIRKDKKNV